MACEIWTTTLRDAVIDQLEGGQISNLTIRQRMQELAELLADDIQTNEYAIEAVQTTVNSIQSDLDDVLELPTASVPANVCFQMFCMFLNVLSVASDKLFPNQMERLKFQFSLYADGSMNSHSETWSNVYSANEWSLIGTFNGTFYFSVAPLSLSNIAKYIVAILVQVTHTNWLLQMLCMKVLGKKYTDQLLRMLATPDEEK